MERFLESYPELALEIDVLDSEARRSHEDYDLLVKAAPSEDSNWFTKPILQVRLGLYSQRH